MYVDELNVNDIIFSQDRLYRVCEKPTPGAAFVKGQAFTGQAFNVRQDILSMKDHAEIRVSDIECAIRAERVE